MGDLDNNQFQLTNETLEDDRALQRITVTGSIPVVSNGEARAKHHLSTYTEDEKRWLIRIEDEERQKGSGFMQRLKVRWDQQYPERTNVSKQNLRDNAAKFRAEIKEIGMVESVSMTIDAHERITNKAAEWTNEMKLNLLRIEKVEREKGRGFMKRMKKAWDLIYEDRPLSAQCLRDNAARFHNDKSLMNLLLVRDECAALGELREENEIDSDLNGHTNRSATIDSIGNEVGEVESETVDHTEKYGNQGEESNELVDMRRTFMETLQKLKVTTNRHIEERERLMKLKTKTTKVEFDNANKILENYLGETDDICKVIDAVYAMGRTIEERSGIKREKGTKTKQGSCMRIVNRGGNRRIKRKEKQLKEARQMVAWIGNEIFRQDKKRKAIKKELKIVAKVMQKARSSLSNKASLLTEKELWLDELRYRKAELNKVRTRDAKIRNNRMFKEDERRFYRNINCINNKKGVVPDMEKFVAFWAEIWEDETKTPHKKWMDNVSEKIKAKVQQVEDLVITERTLYEIIRKRKNWSAPGVDGIQNFWWKKFRGAWKSLVKCMSSWITNPQRIPGWLTLGRTILLPKTEDLSHEKDYRPITCLNTCYKIFSGMIGKHMKAHADTNGMWDKGQLGTCSGVLGTVDQLLVDNAIMDEVRNSKRNLAVAFYDYQKAYDMVRHDWMLRVYEWMGIPASILNVLNKLMSGWKSRLELNEGGKLQVSRWIKISKGFLQGDSYSPVGFCLTEVPVAMFLEETDGYRMGAAGERMIKRTHSLFIDDLKVYKESHKKLEIVNEIIVKVSSDTGACYGVKKCAEVVFKDGKMIKGMGLDILQEKMRALDPNENEIYKFLGCEQGDKIDVKRVMERVKKEVKRRTEQLVSLNLNDENLMKAINCRVIPVAGYIMNVCNLRKGDLEQLDKSVKAILRDKGFHGRQASDERLYMKRVDGGRGLKSFKEVYDETKVRVACYMATSTNIWIKAAWEYEHGKEFTSIKREAEEVMKKVQEDVEFGIGSVRIRSEHHKNWRAVWKTLKKMINDGTKRNKVDSFRTKILQSEIPLGFDKGDYGWLRCNSDPRKTASIFSLQEQMVEIRSWKKLRGLISEDCCRLCGEYRETVQHLLAGCQKLAGFEYVRRHDKALKVLAVQWCIKNGLLPDGTKWYEEKWEKGKVIERGGKKLLWDWEYRMRTTCTSRRPDLTLEDNEKNEIYIVDMACPSENNKVNKRLEKIQKYQQLCFELRERRSSYKIHFIPAVIGCLGGGVGQLEEDLCQLIQDSNERSRIVSEMQKTVLWESETIVRKVFSGLI